MDQKELYNLAGKLDTKDVAYLVASHMEHIGKCEFGFRINADQGYTYVGKCRCYYPGEKIEDDIEEKLE